MGEDEGKAQVTVSSSHLRSR